MHHRNPYLRLPWAELRCEPLLAPFFSDVGTFRFGAPGALRELTAALLARDWAVRGWVCEPGRLCPPLPGRLNYVLWAEDLVAATELSALASHDNLKADSMPSAALLPQHRAVIDVGTGASAILSLLATRVTGWPVAATELDTTSLRSARENVVRARLASHITVLATTDDSASLLGSALTAAEAFLVPAISRGDASDCPPPQLPPYSVAMTLCNPPFFRSWEEARASMDRARPAATAGGGSGSAVCNDNNDDDASAEAVSLGEIAACDGAAHEMACVGGEEAFVGRLIDESAAADARTRVLWFTSMLGKQTSVAPVVAHAVRAGACAVRSAALVQGRTRRWAVGWSFAPAAALALADGLRVLCPLQAAAAECPQPAIATRPAAVATAAPLSLLSRPFVLLVGCDGSSKSVSCGGVDIPDGILTTTIGSDKSYCAAFSDADAAHLLALARSAASGIVSGARADNVDDAIDRIAAAIASPRTHAVAAEDTGLTASAVRTCTAALMAPFCEGACESSWRVGGLSPATLAVFRGHAVLPAAPSFLFEVQIWRLRAPVPDLASAPAPAPASSDEPLLIVPVLLASNAHCGADEAANRRRFDRWAERLRADVLRTGRRWRRLQSKPNALEF